MREIIRQRERGHTGDGRLASEGRGRRELPCSAEEMNEHLVETRADKCKGRKSGKRHSSSSSGQLHSEARPPPRTFQRVK